MTLWEHSAVQTVERAWAAQKCTHDAHVKCCPGRIRMHVSTVLQAGPGLSTLHMHATPIGQADAGFPTPDFPLDTAT